MEKTKRRQISFSIKKRFWVLPCTVCGVPYETHVDHIIPLARGGTDDLKNLQPLCAACNLRKKDVMSNADLVRWVLSRGLTHFTDAEWRKATRCQNPFDKEEKWIVMKSDKRLLQTAILRLNDFLERFFC